MAKIVRLSNSMAKNLQSCSTLARLRSDGFGLLSQPDAPLKCGVSCHKAFEAWIQEARPDDCVQVFLDDYQSYSESYLLSTGKGANYWHENVAKILDVFFSSNPILAMPFVVVQVETPSEIEIARDSDHHYVMTDKADALVRMKDTGDLYSFENKTTKWISENWIDDYLLDSQVTCHVAAARENGLHVKGVFLQLLAINKLPDGLATTKTGKPARCRVEGHGFVRDCWQNHVRWVRDILTRSERDIELWWTAAAAIANRYRRVLEAPFESLPMEGLFGKCGRCDFLRFCRSHRQNWDLLVKREKEEGVIYSGIYDD